MIPKPLKKWLIKIQYIPEKIKLKIYYLASQGKIPFPDKAFQNMDYKLFNNGKKINFKNPQTYNEKLQWLKYYYRDPRLTPLVDKYEVRKYVKEKVGDEILVPCLGIYDSWEEIDFESLPDRFVVKCTHDSGSISICRDKKTWDKNEAEKIIKNGLGRNQFYLSREWPYKNVKPRIIIERYLENEDKSSLIDYKFYCFDGEPVIVDVLTGKNREEGVRENFYDMNWNLYEVTQGHPNTDYDLPKPFNYEKMIEYAKILSKGFPHIRVDFIEENDKLFFTELTFFSAGGRIPLEPESFDEWLGGFIKLPDKIRNK